MDPNRDLRGVGVPLELIVGHERIRVWLDEAGIHFVQSGSTAEGHLPWSVALAASLLPFDLPRVGMVVEAA
jgi:hypothetical protein